MTWFHFYNPKNKLDFYWEVESDGKSNILIIRKPVFDDGNEEHEIEDDARYTGIIGMSDAENPNAEMDWTMLDDYGAMVIYEARADEAKDVDAADDVLNTLLNRAFDILGKPSEKS